MNRCVAVDFLSEPTDLELEQFRLPDNQNLNPPIADRDLYYVGLDSDLDRDLREWHDPKSKYDKRAKAKILDNMYSRSACHNPGLDSDDGQSPMFDGGMHFGDWAPNHFILPYEQYDKFLALHGGLSDLRICRFLEAASVVQLALRLIAWSQDQPPVHLDRFDSPTKIDRLWWITPLDYVILVPALQKSLGKEDHSFLENRETRTLDPQNLNAINTAFGKRDLDYHQFQNARFTLHIVHFADDGDHRAAHNFPHWSLFIRQTSSGNTWYFDSITRARARRHRRAKAALDDWLMRSYAAMGIGNPPVGDINKVVNTPNQHDGSSCSLHTIANAAVFVRFGMLGWHHIPRWSGGTSLQNAQKMFDELQESLHNLLGLTVDKTKGRNVDISIMAQTPQASPTNPNPAQPVITSETPEPPVPPVAPQPESSEKVKEPLNVHLVPALPKPVPITMAPLPEFPITFRNPVVIMVDQSHLVQLHSFLKVNIRGTGAIFKDPVVIMLDRNNLPKLPELPFLEVIFTGLEPGPGSIDSQAPQPSPGPPPPGPSEPQPPRPPGPSEPPPPGPSPAGPPGTSPNPNPTSAVESNKRKSSDRNDKVQEESNTKQPRTYHNQPENQTNTETDQQPTTTRVATRAATRAAARTVTGETTKAAGKGAGKAAKKVSFSQKQ
ncbi:hypothetical protein B0H66DRAFT_600147 [Apodospora peruviana]|uniref:Ubiquitin-like protease family profile domain-containing protein n=1 Tax=Apodospora peruviana TaxID=516989 RepID=A0AAE0IKG5_9PEZI|nr:hypothetical protein B0H66DRAFT_600147 [Apodospora peruviana]